MTGVSSSRPSPHPAWTDSIINGPASSYYSASFYIYHAGAPAKALGRHILNNVTFLRPTPAPPPDSSPGLRQGHAHRAKEETVMVKEIGPQGSSWGMSVSEVSGHTGEEQEDLVSLVCQQKSA